MKRRAIFALSSRVPNIFSHKSNIRPNIAVHDKNFYASVRDEWKHNRQINIKQFLENIAYTQNRIFITYINRPRIVY